jgi:hypothetical protein
MSAPERAVSATSSRAPQRGSIALGTAQRRGDSWFVPVIVTSAPGSETPHALSLGVSFAGDTAGAAIRRAGNASGRQPVFEISRSTASTLSYVVAFDANATVSGVIAEIEVPAARGKLRLEIEPRMTMLSDEGGTAAATVANGRLQVSGTTVGDTPAAPAARTRKAD